MRLLGVDSEPRLADEPVTGLSRSGSGGRRADHRREGLSRQRGNDDRVRLQCLERHVDIVRRTDQVDLRHRPHVLGLESPQEPRAILIWRSQRGEHQVRSRRREATPAGLGIGGKVRLHRQALECVRVLSGRVLIRLDYEHAPAALGHRRSVLRKRLLVCKCSDSR